MSNIRERYLRISEDISRAARTAGRSADEIELIAVSKTVGPDRVREAHQAGIACFGENRAQELVHKTEALIDLDLKWHFIGHIQTNKVRFVVPPSAMLHSLTTPKLASLVQRQLEGDAIQPVLVQINTTGETSKSGIKPADLPFLLDGLTEFDKIRVDGLMTIGPLGGTEAEVRAAFRSLRELGVREQSRQRPRQPLTALSMGMSGDFEIAIEEGATIVRIGTGIFGPRDNA